MRFFARWDPNLYSVLVVILAIGIRALPIVASWPYALGFDTTALYVPLMLGGPPSPYSIFTYPGFHSAVVWFVYQLLKQPFLVLDSIAIFLQGALALSTFYYARLILSFDKKIAFLASVLFTLSPITLRLTWDQYRISIGLIAAITALTAIRSNSRGVRATTLPAVVLAILSNPLPSVFLLLTLIVQTVRDFAQNRMFRIGLVTSTIGIIIFALQQSFLASSGLLATYIHPFVLGPVAGTGEALFGIGFVLFTSWPVLLFLPFVFKFRESSSDTVWLVMIAFFAIVLLIAGVYTIPPAFIYFMASFPLAMYAGRALKKFGNIRIFRMVFGLVLLFLAVNAVTYLISSPISPMGYMALDQPFRYYLPTGYLQSTVPISYQKDLMQLLTTSISSLPRDASLYLPRQFYGLALLVQNPQHLTLVDIGEANPWLPSPFESVVPNGGSFTIWFIKGSSWYGISTLPANFETLQTQGQFALYEIVS